MTEAIQERLRALPKEPTFLCHWKERTKEFGEYYFDQNKRQPIENVQNTNHYIWIIWNQVSVQKYPRRKNAGEPQDGSASHMSRGNKLIINANPSVIFSSASSPHQPTSRAPRS